MALYDEPTAKCAGCNPVCRKLNLSMPTQGTTRQASQTPNWSAFGFNTPSIQKSSGIKGSDGPAETKKVRLENKGMPKRDTVYVIQPRSKMKPTCSQRGPTWIPKLSLLVHKRCTPWYQRVKRIPPCGHQVRQGSPTSASEWATGRRATSGWRAAGEGWALRGNGLASKENISE